jgi:glycosyltransferase involved in cell wall biosynthesis
MRVLFLTCHLPYPPVSGGRLREHELLRRICCDHEVHLCAVSKTYEQDLAAADAFGDCASVAVFEAQPGSADLPAQIRRHCSDAASRHVRELLDEVDLVHVEGFYLAHHVPSSRRVPLLLVEQNVEYSLWAQRVAVAGGYGRQRQAFREFRETRAWEIAAWRRADLCATVTDDDRTAILRVAPDLDVRVVPDGIDHLGGPPPDRAEPRARDVVFVANFAYEPNADAAVWFCREIVPRLRALVPGVRALLVGNEPPADVRDLACDHVDVTGRVRRVERYLDRAALVVSPLRVGGGIKVKVLEALCRGKAIVSTSVGVQGLGPDAGRAIAVADEPKEFAEACAQLLLDEDARRRREREAERLAATLPTWDEAAASLAGCYRELVVGTRLAEAEGAELR